SDYVNQAYRASDQGVAAFKQYRDMLAHQAFTEGLANTVDPMMTGVRKPAHPGTVADLAGNTDNLSNAVQIFPVTSGADVVASPDFDVFNEILTGTRGGGHHNLDTHPQDWEPQHGEATGYFDDDAAALPGICQESQYHRDPRWPNYA